MFNCEFVVSYHKSPLLGLDGAFVPASNKLANEVTAANVPATEFTFAIDVATEVMLVFAPATVLILPIFDATTAKLLVTVDMVLPIPFPWTEQAYNNPDDGAAASTTIVTLAPEVPAVPVVVTPVVYAADPFLNTNGCPELLLSDKSNM